MFAALTCGVLRSFAIRLLLATVFLVSVVLLDAGLRSPPSVQARASWPMPEANFSGLPRMLGRGHIPMPVDTPAAHSSTLLAMPGGHPDTLLAFWFAGTKESAHDVGIAVSGFARATQHWRPAHIAVNRQALGQQLGFGVRRLGNPVAWLDGQGRVHLFVVATGLGGWAASRIVQLRQSFDQNRTPALSEHAQVAIHFDVVRVLPLSWWWNISHLVRTAPMPLQDGGMVLPVHFELGIKYPMALRFDAHGDFNGMVRLSTRTHVLQPTLVALDASNWLGLMRDQRPDGRVTVVRTQDGGQQWRDLPDLALSNPDASTAAIALAPGQLWLVFNSSVHSRQVLDLSHSVDGKAWQLTQRLAKGSGTDEYSYPALAWADDSLWVSYTDQRKRIAWQRFAWPPR